MHICTHRPLKGPKTPFVNMHMNTYTHRYEYIYIHTHRLFKSRRQWRSWSFSSRCLRSWNRRRGGGRGGGAGVRCALWIHTCSGIPMPRTCASFRWVAWLVYLWHDSFTCGISRSFVTWLVYLWHDLWVSDMAHLFEYLDARHMCLFQVYNISIYIYIYLYIYIHTYIYTYIYIYICI